MIMGMTMTQKVLARAAGQESVKAGDLILARLDLVLGNDITAPVGIREFKKLGLDATFDHSGLDEAAAAAAQYDLVFTPMNLVKQFDLPKSCT